MTTLDLLIAGRAKIEDPKYWCQGALARDCDGGGIHPAYPNAVQWCSAGAIHALTSDDESIVDAVMALSAAAGFRIGPYNDTHNHRQVMKVWDKAIATERGKVTTRPTDISSLTTLLDITSPVLEAA